MNGLSHMENVLFDKFRFNDIYPGRPPIVQGQPKTAAIGNRYFEKY